MSMPIRKLTMAKYREAVIKLMDYRLRALAANDYETNNPIFIWGLPAVGKSKILEAICRDTWLKEGILSIKELYRLRPWDAANWSFYSDEDIKALRKGKEGWILMDVRLSQVDPVEIKGAPYYDIKNGKAGFLRFNSILPDPNCPYPIILFLDEFPLAPDMVQSAGYQLINDRKVGDYRLPEKCVVMAAGNPPDIVGVHFEMGLALETRFDHIGLDIDYKGFVKYMGQGSHGYDETLVAYLQYSLEQDKQVIYKLDQGKGNMAHFRSWEKAARKIKYGYNYYDAIADSVGQAAAAKFETFKELTKDIPDAETLVTKKMYYEDIQLQLVASQKVGNSIISPDLNKNKTPDEMFEFFKYFIDMRNPKDKADNREELTVLFLVNVRDDMEVLERVDKGFQEALKAGKIKIEKNDEGEKIEDIYALIFNKWKLLHEIE